MVACLVSIPSVVKAVEFQTPGAMGMGGAGVARDNGALTSYWNPAGAAFIKSTFAVKAAVGAGISGSEGLTENIDRLADIDFDNVKNFNSSAAEVGEIVKTLTILDDMKNRQGNFAVNVSVPLGLAVKNIAFGVYGTMEGYVQPIADMTNIIPKDVTNSDLVSVQELATAVGGGNTASGYFTSDQLAALTTLLDNTYGLTTVDATQLANAIDTQLQNSGIDPATVYSAVTDQILPTLSSGAINTLDKNTTAVMTKAIQYVEVPVSYGRTVDKKGKLAFGVTGKLISGTVYQSQILLVNRTDGTLKAQDIVDEMTNNKKTSSAIGIDVGALYKVNDKLNLGIVAKNINSPKFDTPSYQRYLTLAPNTIETVPGGTVELKPQVRAGVALEPFGWMIFAADLDLTENDTVAPGTVVGSSYKSRNFGGGFEFKPASWLKVRGGAYKNLAMDNGAVLTAGFKLFMLDVDGAFATQTFVYDGNEIPREVKVNAGMSFTL